MNQNARKTAKTKVEKDFYKLLNNSNFGNDCRNNIWNCKLDLLYDGLDEISYIKKFTNIFNYDRFSEFFSVDLLKEQIISEYNQKIENLDQYDPFYFSIRENIERKYEEDLEEAQLFLKKRRKENLTIHQLLTQLKRKLKIVNILEKIKWLLNLITINLLQ